MHGLNTTDDKLRSRKFVTTMIKYQYITKRNIKTLDEVSRNVLYSTHQVNVTCERENEALYDLCVFYSFAPKINLSMKTLVIYI